MIPQQISQLARDCTAPNRAECWSAAERLLEGAFGCTVLEKAPGPRGVKHFTLTRARSFVQDSVDGDAERRRDHFANLALEGLSAICQINRRWK